MSNAEEHNKQENSDAETHEQGGEQANQDHQQAEKTERVAMGTRESSTGLEDNLAALLSYVLGWVTGLVFLLMEEKSSYVKFHALQSVAVFLPLQVMAMVPIIGWMLAPFITLIAMILWLFLMYKAYHGERFKLPIVGDFAERHQQVG
jgi:uncharacterized membrane protein